MRTLCKKLFPGMIILMMTLLLCGCKAGGGETPEEAAQLTEGLADILEDIESGKLPIDPAAEDIHMFVEQVLT